MNPVEKLRAVNAALGVNIGDNQATTRTVWDTITLPAATSQITFFKGSNTRALPLSNLPQNRLEVDGNLILQKVIIAPFATVAGSYDFTTFIDTVDPRSVFNLKIGNDVVLKDIPLMAFTNEIGGGILGNEGVQEAGYFIPFNSIIIPPQIEFEATITLATNTGSAAFTSVRCILQGFGTQFSNQNY